MIIKSNPLVIPKKLANELLNCGKSENTLTKIQKTVHKMTVDAEFFPFMYLSINHTIANMEIIGNIKVYKNILSPFKIDV